MHSAPHTLTLIPSILVSCARCQSDEGPPSTYLICLPSEPAYFLDVQARVLHAYKAQPHHNFWALVPSWSKWPCTTSPLPLSLPPPPRTTCERPRVRSRRVSAQLFKLVIYHSFLSNTVEWSSLQLTTTYCRACWSSKLAATHLAYVKEG